MSLGNIKWGYVIVFALLSIGIASLAYYSYDSFGLRRPLEKAVLDDPDVLWIEVSDETDCLVIEVALGLVEDLGSTYKRICGIVENKGTNEYQLMVRDNRDPEIENIYRSIHYYLYEAAVRGNFGTMIEACREILDDFELTGYLITVDQKHIYVQLVDNDKYLYEILDISL